MPVHPVTQYPDLYCSQTKSTQNFVLLFVQKKKKRKKMLHKGLDTNLNFVILQKKKKKLAQLSPADWLHLSIESP